MTSFFRSQSKPSRQWPIGLLFAVLALSPLARHAQAQLDFNRDIRPILSNKCFLCHGPDEAERKGGSDGLRLDTSEGALEDLGGYAAIVPGKPDESEVVRRIQSEDESEKMPPADSGKSLTADEVQKIVQWIQQGARYDQHWSYIKPVRYPLPVIHDTSWPKNEIDYFVLARLEQEGLKPQPEADRYALIRRVALDLTGLPPTWEEVQQFVNDTSSDAYEKLVDRMLEKKSFGEHWARMWLDLARYADSAGYADDPPRTIWAYRDYVIRSFNDNKPFDQFTIEQLAGDLLPQPAEEHFIATAFHRNTLTNNEGGTNDEEFRNVAIVDRVNTTLAVWMGTTISCAQCHNHKYDPISQEEFFKVFAVFNNSADADRTDEGPTIPLYSAEQLQQKQDWQHEIDERRVKLQTPTPELLASQAEWEMRLAPDLVWQPLAPTSLQSKAAANMKVLEDQSVLVERGGATDVYSLEFPYAGSLAALRIETLPHESLPGGGSGHGGGNFVLSQVRASVIPPAGERLAGRYVRIELPGTQKILSLAEVEIFNGADNIARAGDATQSSTAFDGHPQLAIDGNTNGDYFGALSTTHTQQSDNPWWELDLKTVQPLDRIAIWNRTDNELHTRLANFTVTILDENRGVVWQQTIAEAPKPNAALAISGAREVPFSAAIADYAQPSFGAEQLINNMDLANRGWAIGGQVNTPHSLTLIPITAVDVAEGSKISLSLEHASMHEHHTLGHFRASVSADARAAELARLPEDIRTVLKSDAASRSDEQKNALTKYYLAVVAPQLQADRERLATLEKQLAEMQPMTTIPVMRELPENERRVTRLQFRGNFLDLGNEVQPGAPAVFPPLPSELPPNRLAIAKWLVDENNPLTARVVANRFWEQIFGIGIVRTSEEFGAQGELPSHPELLDWLATELIREQWNVKQFLKLLVTSAAYRQSSRVTPELFDRDPDNRLLARGPRFRLSAEMIRDQALAVSGLLSEKLYGPPVKPPQPAVGLSAAFGSGIDWQTSSGEDKYRRALYTTWRRSNPYPSMTTFDAPNREVCTVRRSRTNTPLQALVTLNDPVYVEAAQALSRQMIQAGSTPAEKVTHAFHRCLLREPSASEVERLCKLYETTFARYSQNQDLAIRMATDPLGPAAEGTDMAELAAWTVVANVLLNLDESLMKR